MALQNKASIGCLAGVLFLLAGLGASADTYPKDSDIDVLHYRFQIALSDDTDEIVGEATVTVRFRADGISRLRLDLINSTSENDRRGMQVDGVTAGEVSLRYVHQDNVLWISLAEPSQAGELSRITIQYRGVPATGLIIGKNKHGDRTFFSDNWPNKARNWLPTVDHPYDKATCEFLVTAPVHYQVVSNGLLVEETNLLNGKRLTRWKQSVPIPVWLYVLGVARFAVQHWGDYQGRPLQTWVYAQDRDAGFHDFSYPTKQVLEFFGGHIGPYSYEKLANVQSHAVRGGAMESATAISYAENSVTGERPVRWRNVITHELAHQWFGNSVTEYDWDDVWLSEGFATYFTLLFIEHAFGRDEFVAGLKRSRDRVQRYYEEHPDARIVHDNLSDMSNVLNRNIYQKGGWTLHMLRGVIGTEAFWKGIRSYYQKYQNGHATTGDFRRTMEDVSGEDLEWFFQQWLYQPGWLKVEGHWSYNSEAGTVEIVLKQIQDDDSLFRMPMEIGIFSEGESRPGIERIVLDGQERTFRFAVALEPTKVVLDPNNWVLMESSFVKKTP